MKWPVIKINIVSLWKLWKYIHKHILRQNVNRSYGLIRDKKDKRDFIYKATKPCYDMPVTTDRKNISEFQYVYDQGSLGSCCAFGAVEAFRRVLQVNKMPDWEASPLFAYWTLRSDKSRDCGGQIRDAFKAMNQFGICCEKTWPYIPCKLKTEPPHSAFIEALDHQSIVYERIYPVTKLSIMDAISRGYPVVFGMDLHSSFESDWVKETGLVPMPEKNEAMVGGHCMIIFDYDELGVVILNSWGRDWGIYGTCHITWEHILKEEWCNDFWVLYKSE
jgi:C1A family cysteine protease